MSTMPRRWRATGRSTSSNKEGKATTIKAGASWQVLSSADFAEQAIATPAIVDGSMYVRTEETLYSFGVNAR